MSEKLVPTAILLFSFGFFRFTGPITASLLREFHEIHNPLVVKKAPWIFKTFEIIPKVFAYACLMLIPLIWFEILVVSFFPPS